MDHLRCVKVVVASQDFGYLTQSETPRSVETFKVGSDPVPFSLAGRLPPLARGRH